MADDGSININTKLNTEGLQKGLKEVESQTDAILQDIASTLKTISAQVSKVSASNDKAAKSAEKAAKKNKEAAEASKEASEAAEAAAKASGKTSKGLISSAGSIKDNIKSWADLGGAVTAVSGVYGAAAAAVGGMIGALNECAAAYKVQEKAEQQLANAIRNNPYVDGAAEAQIKAFAAELQSTSEIGDELSISLGAMLVASGKDANQTMQILQTAADLAAGSTMEFEQAVEALNASFTGSAGELEDLLPAIGQLSEEELRSGKAVDMLSGKFKGFAESTADAGVQLKNAWGDFKEGVGRGWDELLAPAKRALTGFLSGIASSISDYYEVADAKKMIEDGTAGSAQFETAIKDEQELVDDLQAKIDLLNERKGKLFVGPKFNAIVYEYGGGNVDVAIENLQKAQEGVKERIAGFEAERDALKALEDAAAAAAQAEADRQKAAKDRDDFIKGNQEALERDIFLIKERARVMGEEVDQSEIRNAMLQSYLNLISTNSEWVTADSEIAKERLAILADQVEKTEEWEAAVLAAAEAQKEFEAAQNGFNLALEKADISTFTNKTTSEQMGSILSELDATYAAILESGLLNEAAKAELVQQYEISKTKLKQTIDQTKKREDEKEAGDKFKDVFEKGDMFSDPERESDRLKAYLDELDKTYAAEIVKLKDNETLKLSVIEEYEQKRAEIEAQYRKTRAEEQAQEAHEQIQQVAEFASQFENVINAATDVAKKAVDAEAEEQMAALKKQYEAGEIDFEKFEAEKEKIEKESAKKKYQLDMVNWSASILNAGINVALGISGALAEPGTNTIQKAINAALIGALGAVQIATIMANKPKPPSFEGGGIVPGMSYTGDRVQANVNSGEMILNAAQQRRLWDAANGRGSQTGVAAPIVNMPITVENNAGANVGVNRDERQLRVVIDEAVNASMQEGRYTHSMKIAESRDRGIVYL